MPFAGVLWGMISWFFRAVVLKFVVMGMVFIVVVELIPVVLHYVTGFIDPTALTASFSMLSPGVWWLLDFARIDYGLPRILSAAVAVFIIRRIPFVG